MFRLVFIMDWQISPVKGKSKLVDHWVVIDKHDKVVWDGPAITGPPVGWQLRD